MKILPIILLSLFSTTNTLCHKNFELINATSQKWVGGRPEAGRGTYYELTIVPNSNSENLVFDKLWVGKKFFDIQTFQKGKRMRNNLFAKGDTVTIRVNKRIKIKTKPFVTKEDTAKIVKKQSPPKEYEGEALLSYLYKGKRKYFEIKTFTAKEPAYYP